MAKKIIYLANMRLPNERPHGIQIMKTCEALKKQGADIELWVAARKKSQTQNLQDFFSFYGISQKFKIKMLPVWDFLPSWWKSGFYLESFSFLISAIFAIKRLKEDFILYTRDEIMLFSVFFAGTKVFWEAHLKLRSTFLQKARLLRISGIVAISESLKKIISQEYKYSDEKIIVAHDAVDLGQFSNFLKASEAKKLLGVPSDKKVAVYSGGLFEQKGVFTLLEAARLFGEEWLFLIVGGNPGDQTDRLKEIIAKDGLKNIILTGHVKQSEVKKYLAAADVLVLPNSNLDERTRLFTSPLKLFEYMSSGRPIVASATPTILEVLNKNNAILVEPDNSRALKEGMARASNKEISQSLAERAKIDVRNYTWDKRAEQILNFLERNI